MYRISERMLLISSHDVHMLYMPTQNQPRNFAGVLGRDRIPHLAPIGEDIYVPCSSDPLPDNMRYYVTLSHYPSLSLSLALFLTTCMPPSVFQSYLEGTVPSESPDPQARARWEALVSGSWEA